MAKKHKHQWDLGDEPCHQCGAYMEYCRVKDCYAMRECTGDGKCEVYDED